MLQTKTVLDRDALSQTHDGLSQPTRSMRPSTTTSYAPSVSTDAASSFSMPRYAAQSATATTAIVNGREMLVFAGCNYLGLAHHPAVLDAATQAIRRFGLSTSASRETTGNTSVHDELERRVCDLVQTDDAVVVPDGYLANLAAAQALVRDHPVAIIDERAHKSVHDAAFSAGMKSVLYRHRDANHAAELVRIHRDSGVVIMTDGVFTADGAVAPLAGLAESALSAGPRVRLLVDDCHGLGTLGPRGEGTLAHCGVAPDPRIVITSTLAKGIGCHGGFVASDRSLAKLVRTVSHAYVCVTPVSPVLAAAALESFSILQNDPQRLRRLRDNTANLQRKLLALGLPVNPTPAPIFAFAFESAERMLELHRKLFEQGILAPYIKYPAGPAPTFFRLSMSSEHTPQQIERLAEGFRSQLATNLASVPTHVA